MAQKISVVIVDDIDGSEAAETVRFALDGVSYEIDLSSENAAELRELTARYTSRARKAAGSARRAPRPRSSAENGPSSGKIRDWAKDQGIKINNRGRVPAGVVAQYETANSR